MTTARDLRLSPDQLALKLACREAVRAAGGQDFVAAECGRAQSCVSDWTSPNTAVFMPIDAAARIEALGAGSPGHPQITRALARAQGGAFVAVDGAAETPVLAKPLPNLGSWLGTIGGDAGELMTQMARGNLAAPLTAMPECQRSTIARELDDAIDGLAALRAALKDSDTT